MKGIVKLINKVTKQAKKAKPKSGDPAETWSLARV